MKKNMPLTLVLLGAALLITAVIFLVDSNSSAEPQSFGQSLRDWITLLAGLGASIKGWTDLFKKEQPSKSPQSNIDGGINIIGEVKSVSGGVAGRDIVQTYVTEDSVYNVEGLPNPYIGLRAFRYDDRDSYAGREKLTEEALELLVTPDGQQNLLIVSGASGSGKSSFVQAGLLPAVMNYYKKKGFFVFPPDIIRPSRNPKARLDGILRTLNAQEMQIIIIDQFEELFTQSIPNERDSLVEYLCNLPPFESCKRIFIATLRSDYLGEVFDIPKLWESATQGIPLRAMRLNELRDAIQQPLRFRFPDIKKRFDPKLVEKLAKDTIESVTYLPLLQVTLEEIWNKGELKLSAYNTLADAIKERADTVLAYSNFDIAIPSRSRTKDEQDSIIELLHALVNVSIDDDARRDARISRRMEDFSTNQKKLLYDLSRARLVSIDFEDGKEVVNLIHEALIQSWDVLRDSIKLKRAQLQKRARFEAQFRLWVSLGFPEKYLLSKGQIDEARELEQDRDVALQGEIAKEFLYKSEEKIDFEQRQNRLINTVDTIKRFSKILDIDVLLKMSLQNAVSLSDAEIGNLFLIDEKTGEIISGAVYGSIPESRITELLSPENDFIVQAKIHRKGLITSNVEVAGNNEDEMSNFDSAVSRSIMVVPMEADGQLFGLISMMRQVNKQPFSVDDMNFIISFINQIGDYLETRIEESKILRQVELELDASWDVDRIFQVALDWAINQTNADAGIIGLLKEGKLSDVVQRGYEKIDFNDANSLLLLETSPLKSLISSGELQQVMLTGKDVKGFIPGVRSQIVVPIYHGNAIIGLFLLESLTNFNDVQHFLSLLSNRIAAYLPYAQLRDEAEKGSVANSEYVSFVLYNIKNPMTSIKGYTDLLLRGVTGEINEMQSNFLNAVLKNINRMRDMVQQFDDSTRIESGRLRFEFRAVNVGEIIDNIVQYMKPQLDEKKQTIKIELADKLPQIWADRYRVEQIFTELISNSVKYSNENNLIFVLAQESENKWDDLGSKQVVHFMVKDDGIGIKDEDQANLFNKYFRSDDSEVRNLPGMGLGLYLSKSLIEILGGRIWVESEFRKGSTFHFTIPVAEG